MAQQVPPAHGSDRGVDRDAASGQLGPADQAARGAGRRAPFVCQNGNRVLLLEARPLGWILAELRFEPSTCRYTEVRRTRYRWPREAAGALLSRAFAEGDAIADRTDRDLRAWLIAE